MCPTRSSPLRPKGVRARVSAARITTSCRPAQTRSPTCTTVEALRPSTLLSARALSVGIGFGLQQIVQNFVAGIILLIERPVKVGDWVNVSGVEGDVMDIRVRATEIRTSDRSTVIVPNSSLITMNVQNKTVGDLQTRAGIQVGISKPADAARARDLLLKIAHENPKVLGDPPSEVFVESLAPAAGATVQLSLWVSLTEPRQAHRVKSELYFALLEAFEKEGIALP